MPVKLSIKIDKKLFIEEREKEIISTFMNLVSQEMYANLIKNSPVDHGRLRGAWNKTSSNSSGRFNQSFSNATTYAIFQNDGTYSYGPLKRKPKTKEVGGIKPKRFVEKSMEQTASKLEGLILKAVTMVDK